ncbi:MAG: transglycosylase SLT domain-containing protein [Myxococcales bacterium]|nr:transglycosylase SLT domain-containing protein [Myxococcales bacterium]
MPGSRRAAGSVAITLLLSFAATVHAQDVVPNPAGAGARAPASAGKADPAKPSAPKVVQPKPAAPAPGAKPVAPSANPPPTASAPPPSAASPPAAPPTTPQLPPPPKAAPLAAPAKGASAKPRKPSPTPSKKKGRAPRRPAASLPTGATRPPPPNESARRRIAASNTPAASKKDPELEALRAADRVLFPKPLPGSTPGFSWDLPKPSAKSGPEVVASGMPPGRAGDPGLDDSGDGSSDAEWIRSLTMPDLPVRLESRVVRYLKFYRDNPQGKAIARVWARKSGRYVGALKSELTRAGLPSDLVWLSLIESGHNPTIVSPAGAGGLWQFMPDAGRLYGLTVDRWVDERYDPKRATDAAVMYLGDLYRRFGNWELAMAAYNMGYAGLSRAIRKFNTNDYWELCRYEAGIPWETTLYVPKIFAVALVMANKKAFGLADITPDVAENFDGVIAQAGTPLDRVAAAAGVPVATIEGLNPQFLLGRVPPSRSKSAAVFRVRVPSDRAQQANAALAKLGDPEPELEPYVVRMGDDSKAVIDARSADRTQVLRVNKLRDDEALAPGTVLLLPKRAARTVAAAAASADEVVVVSPREFRYSDRTRVFYRVQGGDNLARIAKGFAVAEGEVLAWNAIDPGARLVSGMTLAIWVKPGVNLTEVRALGERDVRVLVAGTPEFFDYFEGQNGRKRITVEARTGDTLAALGRRYGMSVGWMERINRRSRRKALESGDKLVVYVPIGSAHGKAPAAAPAEPEPLPELEPKDSDSAPATEPAADAAPAEAEPAAGG